MSLIVEDGTGLSTAESYVSVVDADTYLALFTTPASWTAASTTDKEVALRTGSRYIDLVYGIRFKGERILITQALLFPRTGIVTDDNFSIDDDSVPIKLTHATITMATKAIDEDILPDLDVGSSGELEGEKVKVGELEVSSFYSGSTSPYKTYSKIDGFLKDFLRSIGFIERG